MAKFLADAVLFGAQLVGKAFTLSYKKVASMRGGLGSAAANARLAAGEEAVPGAGLFGRGGVVGPQRMHISEARKILNFEATEEAAFDDPVKLARHVNKRYEDLYTTNSVDHGGSFYIQSKIYRAKEAFDNDFKARYGFSPHPGVIDNPKNKAARAAESASSSNA